MIDAELLYNTVGANIQQCRKSVGMSQQELADRLGCARSSVANIERGSQHSGLAIYYSIAKCMGVTILSILPLIESSAGLIPFDSIDNEAVQE